MRFVNLVFLLAVFACSFQDVALGQLLPPTNEVVLEAKIEKQIADTEKALDCNPSVFQAAAGSVGGLGEALGIFGLVVLLLGLLRDGLSFVAAKTESKWDNKMVDYLTVSIRLLNKLIGKFGYGAPGTFKLKSKK